MKIISGRQNLIVILHEGKEIFFQCPAFRGAFGEVAKQINKAELNRPNSSETASLIYETWKSEISSKIAFDWLWEFTGNFYLPKSNEEINNGVILDLDSQNLKFEKGKLVMDKNSLIKRLKENDALVKFVPFKYKIGEQSWRELEKNKYILARYGEEGTQKISEVASKYKHSPKVYSYDFVLEEKIKMSASASDLNVKCRFDIYGGFNDIGVVQAFGILKK